MALLDLNPDQLLSTTRAVRKRLDFSRPVPDEVVRECVSFALQAPSGSNELSMQFVVVRDADRRKALGEVYAECYALYKTLPFYIGALEREDPEHHRQQTRSASSADYLAEHFADAPVIVIPCTYGRTDGGVPALHAALMGNILPATWNFMLAARARGLGTAWTTLHLMQEERVAGLLGIPFAEVQQVCMSPLAYTKGTDFKPAMRPPAESIIHWDAW